MFGRYRGLFTFCSLRACEPSQILSRLRDLEPNIIDGRSDILILCGKMESWSSKTHIELEMDEYFLFVVFDTEFLNQFKLLDFQSIFCFVV